MTAYIKIVANDLYIITNVINLFDLSALNDEHQKIDSYALILNENRLGCTKIILKYCGNELNDIEHV